MKKIYLLITLIATLFLCAYIYHNWYWNNLLKKPKMYVYETYMGPANPVLVISDLKFKNELVDYYNYAKANKDYKSFNFPLKTLPQRFPVYLIEYTSDSLLAKVVSLYYRGKSFGGGFTEGYVATTTLHKFSPPQNDSI